MITWGMGTSGQTGHGPQLGDVRCAVATSLGPSTRRRVGFPASRHPCACMLPRDKAAMLQPPRTPTLACRRSIQTESASKASTTR